MRSTIAVGVDGLEPSLIALRWAVAEAALRGASLVAVIARPSALDWPHDSPRHVDEVNRHISDRIDQIRGGIEGALSHSTGPAGVGSSAVEIQVIEGHPNEVLVGVSKRVDLLVVGGHGYSGWKGAVSGSLTGQLAGHTVTPLAVVRQIPEQARGRILVGVDGLSSAEAIRFGLSEAALRGASVTAVSTWQYPVLGTRPTSPEAAELLEEGAPVSPRGVVLARRFLTDGLSPLFNPSSRRTVTQAVREIQDALEELPATGFDALAT